MAAVRADLGSRRPDPVALGVGAGLAAWLAVTALGQHPVGLFDRVRRHDTFGLLIPNWRFFAPEPAQHDFHVLHRVLTAEGTETPWAQTSHIAPRTWVQTVWFPGRRREKAVFDVCNELLGLVRLRDVDVTTVPCFAMLREFVAAAVRAEHAGGRPPQGFQFLVARHTGHDEEHDPDYLLVSPFIPLEAAP
ncbi:MAG TPA: hypothetical protein VGD11_10455 [Mycobacteriales bacterium]|nr:hypothetical protein [Mycobacteriales bacterium]